MVLHVNADTNANDEDLPIKMKRSLLFCKRKFGSSKLSFLIFGGFCMSFVPSRS